VPDTTGDIVVSPKRRNPSIDHLPAAQAKKVLKKQRTIGLIVILIFMGIFVYMRWGQATTQQAESLKQGAIALRQAIEGDKNALDRAEEAFRRSTHGMILDAYPVFCLELTLQLKLGEIKLSSPDLTAAFKALIRGQYEDTLKALDKVEDKAGKRWMLRLIKDMREPPPG
jgi:hypothetical protein